MALETVSVDRVRKELRSAIQRELPLLEDLRQQVRKLKVIDLGYRQAYAIAPVATDGGENRLSFDPLNVEILRVVDSDGRERFQKIVPLSGGVDVIRSAFNPDSPDRVQILVNLLERLGVSYGGLSELLEAGTDRGDLRTAIRHFRDIAEWAVLLDLAWTPSQGRVLVLRDGMLRTMALAPNVVPKLAKSFEDAHRETGSLLVGVAKRAKVLNYLSLALALERPFSRRAPCFCEVPEDLERRAYRWARAWLEGHSFGRLHLAKLSEQPDAVVLPVDIPPWLLGRRREVLEYLAEASKASFPTIGYPEPLIRAHELAVLHGLEMSVLEDMMVDELMKMQSDADRDTTLEHVSLGHGLQRGGWKEYG